MKTRIQSPIDLLEGTEPAPARSPGEIGERGTALVQSLKKLGIGAELSEAVQGPVLDTYMLKPAPGVSARVFKRRAGDIALALKAEEIYVQEPEPETGLLGILVPRRRRETVSFGAVVRSQSWQKEAPGMALPLAMGVDPQGRPVVKDLAQMPHILVSSAAGQGKSAFLKALLAGLLLRRSPAELKLLLVDTSDAGLNAFEDESRLLFPVIRDAKEAGGALQWAVNEMIERCSRLSRLGVRNIASYNEKLKSLGGALPADLAGLEPMPYIAVVIDELDGLRKLRRKDAVNCIVRLTQLAHHMGIHLVIAAQSLGRGFLAKFIRSGCPCRVCFKVSRRQDSTIILHAPGAEKLLGKGDMLFLAGGPDGVLQRLHGPLLGDGGLQDCLAF